MTVVYCDLETYSEVPINHGTFRYAEGVEVMLFAWAVGDEAEQVWDLTADEPMPERLKDLLDDHEVLTVWHNGGNFDRTMLRHGLKIELPIERVHDTMVRALAHGLPGSLDKLCGVMGITSDAAKDKAGKSLIQLFCKPRPKNMKIRRANRFTHPVEWQRFKEYAKSDIRAMRVLYSKLPRWNYEGRELELWHLDQRINDRGIQVDVDLATGALAAVDAAQVVLARRTRELTNDEVERASKRDQMLRFILKAFDVELPDMKADTLERRIEDPDLPEELKELLRIRLMTSSTSTTKYKALVRAVSRDGRLRGLLQFCGASRTGRWAGRTFQPQNLPRLILDAIAAWFGIRPAQVREEHVEEYLATGIAAIKGGCADLLFDDVMSMCVNVIRGCLVAPPGKKLVVSDLANIEGRFAAWLAGEHWKLKAFRDYDDGSGHDNYVLAYSKAFGVTTQSVLDDKKAGGNQRQIGKVMELMLQYEGGVGAFLTGAATYGFDVEEMAANAIETLPWEARRSAEEMLKWRKKKRLTTYGLSDTAFIVCETFKALWRTSHPAISSYWKELEQAAIRACENPGVRVDARKISFIKSGAWLRMILPSGRSVCYPSAKVEDGKLTYWGVHQYTRKWSKLHTYGGKLFENCLTGDTRVLTEEGWKPIRSVSQTDRVWDGVEWVSHAGVKAMGEQPVGRLDGVGITADHRVLTTKGWLNASSCEGHNRLPVSLPGGRELRGLGREEVDMERALRLRQGILHAGVRAPERQAEVVRLPARGGDQRSEHEARLVGASGLRGLGVDAGALHAGEPRRLGELRRTGDHGLPRLGDLRGVLGRHGPDVRGRRDARPRAEQRRVLESQLPVDVLENSGAQPEGQPRDRHPQGEDAGLRSVRAFGDWRIDAPIPDGGGLAGGQDVRRAGPYEQVFDLIDAGPRHRFVVLGNDGPFIVHNCCQAGARDVMAHNMPTIDKCGYLILLTIHDELITETLDSDEFTPDRLSSLLATNPPWAQGLPLAAGGFESKRYKKD